MFLKGLFKDQCGSSYIQIILASTTIAGLALVGLQLARDQKELALDIYRKYLTNYLHQEVTHFLGEERNCQVSFQGQAFGPLKINGLRSSRSPAKYSFMPQKEVKDKEVIYYEEPVFIKKYQLVAGNGLGHDQLQVTYGVGDTVVEKFIPLTASFDEEGEVTDCSIISPVRGDMSRGPWKKDGELIKTSSQNILFGDENLAGEGVVLKEGIFFEVQSDLSNCDRASSGVIKYIRGKGIRYCRDGVWYPFGQQPLRTNTLRTYRLGVNKVGSKSVVTKKHRHCFITKLKKDLPSDGCKLRRIDREVMSPFEVRAFTSDAVTSMECEVSCVD